MANHAVNWDQYFLNIQSQCPWSMIAWAKGKIDIQSWQGQILELGVYRARMYIVKRLNKRKLKKLCAKLDQGQDEWLWSYPGYGPYATPVPVLIQQNRQQLNQIRQGIANARA